MKQWWLKYAQKINRLTLRERAMVFAAATLVVVYLVFALAIDPAQQKQRLLAAQMQTQREEIAALQEERERLAGAPKADGTARVRSETLTRRIEESDEALRALHKSLVPAQRVNLLLQEMLRGEARLQLVSLRTLAAVPLLPDAPKAAVPPAKPTDAAQRPTFAERNVYKHGVEITVRGSYEDLYNYLARLERSSWRMFWSRARLTTEDHPRLSMTLTIYTLSLDKAWLEV